MFSAIASAASTHPGLIQMQAARREQLQAAVSQEVEALRTPGASEGMARREAREQALTAQHIGPAREAARTEALGLKQLKGIDLSDYYQDLMSGMQAGPKTASAQAAENRYLEARKAF